MSPFGRAHIVSAKRRGVLLASRTCLEEVAVILLPPEVVDIDEDLLARIDDDVKSIYRLIVFSDAHQTTDLLTRYKEALQHLRDVLSVKNAQQEAQTPEEALVYLANLKKCLTFMMEEIGNGRTSRSNIQIPIDASSSSSVLSLRPNQHESPDSWSSCSRYYLKLLILL
jgi:hypothetical protein